MSPTNKKYYFSVYKKFNLSHVIYDRFQLYFLILVSKDIVLRMLENGVLVQ